MKNIYKKIYNDQKNLGDLAESPRVKIMLSMIDSLDLEEKNILDIGCYDGTLLSQIKNRNNNFFGLEASGWAAPKARDKGIDVQEIFFDGSSKLPYEDNFFDLVIAGEIIEHIFDTDYFLEEIRRVLKPGGKFIISTPNIASFGRRLLLFFGYDPIIEISPNQPDSSGHIRYFTFQSLRELLGKNGFKVIAEKTDCLNFSKIGKIKSRFLGKIFKRLGSSIIILAENSNQGG